MTNRNQRRARIRQTLQGTAEKPRLVIYRSNKYIYAQLINDVKGETIASVNKLADPQEAGKKLAEQAVKAKAKSVIFDRAGYKYHGNVKKFADAARSAGLEF